MLVAEASNTSLSPPPRQVFFFFFFPSPETVDSSSRALSEAQESDIVSIS